MTGFWTEADIKRRLDGTFTRVLATGRIVTERVPLNYQPRHIITNAGSARGKSKAAYVHWNEAADALLLQLKANGATHNQCARILGRTVDGIRHRWSKINPDGDHACDE